MLLEVVALAGDVGRDLDARVRRTRATLRSAEFGFFGVWVNTRVQTPRRWGEPLRAGVFDFSGLVSRPLRTSCSIVGTKPLQTYCYGSALDVPIVKTGARKASGQ